MFHIYHQAADFPVAGDHLPINILPGTVEGLQEDSTNLPFQSFNPRPRAGDHTRPCGSAAS
jgi:hypothetical protein